LYRRPVDKQPSWHITEVESGRNLLFYNHVVLGLVTDYSLSRVAGSITAEKTEDP